MPMPCTKKIEMSNQFRLEIIAKCDLKMKSLFVFCKYVINLIVL